MQNSNLPAAQSAVDQQSPSDEQSAANSTSGATSNVSNPNDAQSVADTLGKVDVVGSATTPELFEKRKLIQFQLIALLHANKCRMKDAQATGKVQPCLLPSCSPMKQVLAHMTTCQAGKSCTVPHCSSSSQIIQHWKNCAQSDCPVCVPLKEAAKINEQQAGGSFVASQAYLSEDCQRAFAALVIPYKSGGGNAARLQRGQGSMNQQNLVVPKISGSAGGSKDWRQFLNECQGLRQHLVQKIVKTIFPKIDENTYKDARMINLVAYAEKVEKEMFKAAKSKEEYYMLLAEKIYKIQKELEEKKQQAK